MPEFLRTQDERQADDFIEAHGTTGAMNALTDVIQNAAERIKPSELSILKTAVGRVFQETSSALQVMFASHEGRSGLPPLRDAIVQCVHRLHALLDLQSLLDEAEGAPRRLTLLSTNDRLKKHEDGIIQRIDADDGVPDPAKIFMINNIHERRQLWEEHPVDPYFRTRLLYIRDAEKYLDVPSESWATIDKAVIEPRAGTPWIYRRAGMHHLAAYTPQFSLQCTDVSIGYWQQVASSEQEEFLFPQNTRDTAHDALVRDLTPAQLERARANFEMEQYFRGRREKFPQQWNPEWYALCFADAN